MDSRHRERGHLALLSSLFCSVLALICLWPPFVPACIAAITYTYDLAGRLKCVDDGAGHQAYYSYDSAGNLYSIASSCPPQTSSTDAEAPGYLPPDDPNADSDDSGPASLDDGQ